MKIKTFRVQNYFEPRNNQRVDGLSEMEQQINNFIKGKTVVDIKYQLSASKYKEYYSAMVIYEPEKACNRK